MDYLKDEKKKYWARFFTGPLIWLPLPTLIVLDVLISLYQDICFPIYEIRKLKRSDYILVLDRNRLKYLTIRQKIGCMYCGYANGLLAYSKDIAGLTEKYWCGIMHESKEGFIGRQGQIDLNFAKFDDENEFNQKYKTKQ